MGERAGDKRGQGVGERARGEKGIGERSIRWGRGDEEEREGH